MDLQSHKHTHTHTHRRYALSSSNKQISIRKNGFYYTQRIFFLSSKENVQFAREKMSKKRKRTRKAETEIYQKTKKKKQNPFRLPSVLFISGHGKKTFSKNKRRAKKKSKKIWQCDKNMQTNK